MGNDGSTAMERNLFNLKFAAKDLERSAKKCEKDSVNEKNKLKRAIEQGNMEGAQIYAENVIRNKNQALNFRRMGSRVDAVSQRVQSAVATKKVTQSMAGVVGSMEAAMKSMNLEQISGLMDKFEQQFENLDVQTSVMGDAMQSTTTMTTPQGQVDILMQQVADESGIELNQNLPSAQANTIGAATASQDQDELSQRLAKLRET